jgi:hypothetical protein
MSTMRGRVIKQGGIAVQDGGAGRTNGIGVVRPAFAVSSSTGQRGAVGGPGGPWIGFDHPLFDPGSVSAWRLVAVALAVAYVVGFHVSIGKTRLGLGPGK